MKLDEDLIALIEKHNRYLFRIWESREKAIVLGRSNRAEREVFLDRAEEDNVKILKRLGGGGTVVLTKGVVIISIVKFVEEYFNNKVYFDQINGLIIKGLKRLGIRDLTKQGISDICIRDKKILGSSIYRRNKLLFYQASLLINSQIKTISKYLKHPSKEPGYRYGRKHEDFITTLEREGYKFSKKEINYSIKRVLDDYLCSVN